MRWNVIFFDIYYYHMGGKYLKRGEHEKAERAYRKAMQGLSDFSGLWFNLGLVYKQQHKWQQSLDCNQRVVQLDPKELGAWWNLGIAATALSQWDVARTAWKAYGIKLNEGDGEVRANLGSTPIRINPNTLE